MIPGIHLLRTPGTDRMADRLFLSEDMTISVYENQVPAFAAAEIDRLYGHLYCSLSYFQTAKQLHNASTYVAHQNGVPVTVLLFRREGREVAVLSEFMKLDEIDIHRFVDFIFSAFKSVNVVSFGKVHARLHGLRYPWHAAICSEDMVVTLPNTVKEYEASAGKNMRRNIRRYTSALEEKFPSYCYKIYETQEVDEQHIRDIIRLGCVRMKGKNIVPRYDEKETQWIVNFAKTCGMVGVATIDGRVCAGAIAFRIGNNYFMHVIAHDPQYNEYSLGILCYYLTICEGIARGGKLFHLLQGRYGYKQRLLAQRRDIAQIDIYRGRTQALLHGHRIIKKAVQGFVRAAKQWLLHDAENHQDATCRRIGKLVSMMRTLKRRRAGIMP